MKNVLNVILTLSLVYFSFYYTNLVLDYIKSKDQIMISIKNNQERYKKEPINATIIDNTIIPGISGLEVDINESYLNMKRLNKYIETLLIFKTIKPDISISNNQDKIIISGNKTLNNISILFKIDDINILKNIIKNKDLENISFIISNNFLKENYDYLKTLNNHNLVIKETNYNTYLDIIDYCYTTSNNNCLSINKLTIKPIFITSDYYYNTNKLIDNGSIISYNINNKNINDILVVINYIKSRYNIVSLDEMLKE